MQADDSGRSRGGAGRLTLLLFLVGACFVLPAWGSLPASSHVLGDPEDRLLVELGEALTAARSRALDRSFELFPPRVRALLAEELGVSGAVLSVDREFYAGGRFDPSSLSGFRTSVNEAVTVKGVRGTVGGWCGLLLQGLWTDPVTGLSYARNRWYDARLGAFLSEDPMGDVDSPTLYQFGMNSPFKYSDPMGLESGRFERPKPTSVYFPDKAAIRREVAAMREECGLECNPVGQVQARVEQFGDTAAEQGHIKTGAAVYTFAEGMPADEGELVLEMYIGVATAAITPAMSQVLKRIPIPRFLKKRIGRERNIGAAFGEADSSKYRRTFLDANPELEGDVVVHHAVEQQTLKRYPGVVAESEIHSLENLRGVPNEVNSDVHLSKIRKEWNRFYRQNPKPTKQQLLEKATEIDKGYGDQFVPPVD